MITRKAVKAFLDRKRADFSGAHGWSNAKIDKLFHELPKKPPMWEKLKHIQKICLLLGSRHKRFAFWNDTGTGKTFLCIALAAYFRAIGMTKGVYLALVPNKSNKWEWLREIEKHAPQFKAIVLDGSSVEKWQQLEQIKAQGKVDIVIETFSGLTRMVCEEGQTKKGKTKLFPNKTLVRRMSKLLLGLFIDESTAVKNRASLPYRICRQFAKTAECVFLLTGTPFGRKPEDLWAQMQLVDNGYTLGETLGLFRSAFCKSKVNHWGGVDWTFDDEKGELLNRFLAHRSVRFEADAKDKPEVKSFLITLRMPDGPDAYYRRARETMLRARGNYKAMENAFCKMRQISSGFVGFKDEDDGRRAQFELEPNIKLDWLVNRLLDCPQGEKSIVFHEFIHSGKMLARRLNKEGIGYLLLNGKTKDHQAVLRDFDRDPGFEVLLLNSKAGGLGLNLQVAKNGFYYESPVGVILRRQTEARYIRQGSQHRWVRRFDLVVVNTVDQDILAFHAEGGDLFKRIMARNVRNGT